MFLSLMFYTCTTNHSMDFIGFQTDLVHQALQKNVLVLTKIISLKFGIVQISPRLNQDTKLNRNNRWFGKLLILLKKIQIYPLCQDNNHLSETLFIEKMNVLDLVKQKKNFSNMLIFSIVELFLITYSVWKESEELEILEISGIKPTQSITNSKTIIHTTLLCKLVHLVLTKAIKDKIMSASNNMEGQSDLIYH